MARAIEANEIFRGELVTLRLLALTDCTERYVEWLNDAEVNRWLETRWSEQNLESVSAFVKRVLEATDEYLFAILENDTSIHVGNIKIGPIQPRHSYADLSYFIGERSAWGRGLATDAIRTASRIAFERLHLHRVQAGLYAANVGSAKALLNAGFRREGVLRKQLRDRDEWDDHEWFGLLRDEWQAAAR